MQNLGRIGKSKKFQQLGIDNDGKKPSEISYSQTQDIKKTTVE